MNRMVFLSLLLMSGVFVTGCEEASESPAPSGAELQFQEKAVGQVVPSDNAYALRQQGVDMVFVSVRERAEWDDISTLVRRSFTSW